MVIHQFNRLIKNKWVWGAFAVVICAFFVGIDVIPGFLQDSSGPEFGKLGGENLEPAYFDVLRHDVDFGRRGEEARPQNEINLMAWQEAAALQVAKEMKLEASDEEIRNIIAADSSFHENGAFNMKRYERVLMNNRMSPQFYEAFLKRRIAVGKLQRILMGSATWVSPAELNDAVNDYTDKLTVKVATFVDKDASKVTVGDKEIAAYYNEHTNSYALPECMRVRYVKVKADDPALLAKFKISEGEMRDLYDSDNARFQTKGTNGVTQTKKFDEVKPILERELQIIASIEALRKELGVLIYPKDMKELDGPKVDVLANVAKAKKVQVMTSGRFSLDSKFVRGLMVRASSIAPDSEEFLTKVEDLEVDSPYRRYCLADGTNAVYLAELVPVVDTEKDASGNVVSVTTNGFEKARIATLAEVKEQVRPLALREAQEKAFKAKVDKCKDIALAEIKKGDKGKSFDVLKLEGATISTQMVFSASSLAPSAFDNAMFVARAAMKLKKGEVSEATLLPGSTRALLVYAADRVPGDAAQTQIFTAQLRDSLSRMSAETLSAAWMRYNLDRIGFETSSETSIDE